MLRLPNFFQHFSCGDSPIGKPIVYHIHVLVFQPLAGILCTLGTVGSLALQVAKPNNASRAVIGACSTQAAFCAILLVLRALGAVVAAVSDVSIRYVHNSLILLS